MAHGVRRTALALIVAGLAALIGSRTAWAGCSTDGCNGFLQAFSTQAGTEFGHGVVSGLAGAFLSLVGIRVHHAGPSHGSRVAAIGLSGVILVAVVVFVVGVYVLNDARAEPLHLWGIPAIGVYVTGAGGLLGLVTGWQVRPPA